MFWKFLLFCAFIGMLGAFLPKLWDKISNPIAWLVSFAIPGLFFGILLGGVMVFCEFMCITDSMYIFGLNPFWLGFGIGAGWNILSRLIFWIRH